MILNVSRSNDSNQLFQQCQTALVIGRFQPFHFGHRYLLQKALEIADSVIIVVGSSNIQNKDNPFSYSDRLKMIQTVLDQEKWSNRVLEILPLPDFPTDAEWVHELKKIITDCRIDFDIALGNNDWTNAVLSDAGYSVMPIDLLQREMFQGAVIRDQIAQKDASWKQSIPSYLLERVDSHFQ